MTSTSFGLRNPQLRSSFPGGMDEAPTQQAQGCEEGVEAQRVKNFSGREEFRAPQADDFAKGMLLHKQLAGIETAVLASEPGTLGFMVRAVRRFFGGEKPAGPRPE